MELIKHSIEPRLVKISEALQVPYSSFYGKSRRQALINIKFCIWFYLRKVLRYRLKDISKAFNRNHSTVSYGIKMAGFRKETYPEYQAIYKIIESIFEAF